MNTIGRRIIAVTTLAVAAVLGAGAAAWAITASVSPSTLSYPVYVCVNTANESVSYVELRHPGANCANGYVRYAVSAPPVTPTATPTVTPTGH